MDTRAFAIDTRRLPRSHVNPQFERLAVWTRAVRISTRVALIGTFLQGDRGPASPGSFLMLPSSWARSCSAQDERRARSERSSRDHSDRYPLDSVSQNLLTSLSLTDSAPWAADCSWSLVNAHPERHGRHRPVAAGRCGLLDLTRCGSPAAVRDDRVQTSGTRSRRVFQSLGTV